MAWRFKASKYKNAAPLEPKLDSHIRDLAIGSYHSCGNFIGASAAFMAFNWDVVGSSLAVLPLGTTGRPDKAAIPRIDAHSQLVTDFAWSPFDDGLLATGSQDQTIKLWRIPEAGLTKNLTVAEVTLPEQPRRVETVTWHPAAGGVLTSSCGGGVTVWDLTRARDTWTWPGHGDQVQSVAWQQSGSLLATQAKDKMLRLFDPRSASSAGPVSSSPSHDGMKDSKVVWVGENRILTSGFGGDRARELILRDIRNISAPQKVLSLDVSSGILVPLFDPDTNMVFLAGKGDRYIQFVEVADKEPWFVEGLRHTGDQIKGACLVPKRALEVMQGEVNRVLQVSNTSIIPVTWQVPRKSYREYHADIYPDTPGTEPGMGPQNWLDGANVQPPRQSLDPAKRPASRTKFGPPISEMPRSVTAPATSAGNGHSNNGHQSPAPSPRARVTRCNSEAGQTPAPRPTPRPVSVQSPMVMAPPASAPAPRPKTSVSSTRSIDDSSSADETDNLRRQPSIRDRMKMFESFGTSDKTEKTPSQPPVMSARVERRLDIEASEEDKENKPVTMMEIPDNKVDNEAFLRPKSRTDKSEPFLMPQQRPQHSGSPQLSNNRTSKFGRVTKFKHMKGTPMHKSMHFENLKNLSKSVAADCDVIHANSDRVVVPLSGPGGKLAVFELAKSGRIPDGVVPAVINTATVMDFAWDPFRNSRLAVVTDDGAINLWDIPEGGLYSQVNEPEVRIPAHGEKVNILKFNPVASDIVATAAFDWLIKIWNLSENSKEIAVLEGHTDQIYSLAWSQCGRFLASVCRDGRVRIYCPRTSLQPLQEGGDIVAKKGARVLWACDGKYLIVTGFSRQSERQIMIYQTKDLNCVHTETLDVSPAILIPFYDEDSSTLFLSGKGETTIYGYEIAEDSPHMFPLSPFKTNAPSQGLAFIPHKNALNVRDVEFARVYRLTTTNITPISFTVPRVKSTYFQDDIFPPTRVLWSPACTGRDWTSGSEAQPAWISLKPADMPSLSAGHGNTTISNNTSQQNKTTQSHSIKPNIMNLTKDEAKDLSKDLTKAVRRMVEPSDKLEQDTMEGVDEKDWDEDN